MFETDAEYLRKEEERYKKRGLRIENKDIILKAKYREIRMIFIVTIIISIFYSFVIGFAFGGG